jgi:hypothetical protein
MTKVDLKKDLKHLYRPSAKAVAVVDVPRMNFLMIDGQGNPNTSGLYAAAVEALYAVAYALKFAVKKGASGLDFAVMPLEGLWWADDMRQLSVENKDAWLWTMMIMQPEFVTVELFAGSLREVEKKKGLPALSKLRFEPYDEGQAVQIMHLGAYADEGPTVARLHAFVREQGWRLSGKHHEIYLKDPRKSAPGKLETVVRQPFEK